MARFEVLAVNDSRDFCQCCGRQGLARVVFIRDADTDEVKHFGTTCAIAPAKGFGVEREVKQAIKRFQDHQAGINRATFTVYRQRGGRFINHPTKRLSMIPADRSLYDAIRAEITAA